MDSAPRRRSKRLSRDVGTSEPSLNTVERRRSSLKRKTKRRRSSLKPQDEESLMESSITPRTALQAVMTHHEVMHTVVRPPKVRRIMVQDNKESSSSLGSSKNESDASSEIYYANRRPTSKINERLLNSKPAIGPEKFQKDLKEKLSVFVQRPAVPNETASPESDEGQAQLRPASKASVNVEDDAMSSESDIVKFRKIDVFEISKPVKTGEDYSRTLKEALAIYKDHVPRKTNLDDTSPPVTADDEDEENLRVKETLEKYKKRASSLGTSNVEKRDENVTGYASSVVESISQDYEDDASDEKIDEKGDEKSGEKSSSAENDAEFRNVSTAEDTDVLSAFLSDEKSRRSQEDLSEGGTEYLDEDVEAEPGNSALTSEDEIGAEAAIKESIPVDDRLVERLDEKVPVGVGVEDIREASGSYVEESDEESVAKTAEPSHPVSVAQDSNVLTPIFESTNTTTAKPHESQQKNNTGSTAETNVPPTEADRSNEMSYGPLGLNLPHKRPKTPQPERNKTLLKDGSARAGPSGHRFKRQPVKNLRKPNLAKLGFGRASGNAAATAMPSIVPSSQLKGIVEHFCSKKVSKDAQEEIQSAYKSFLKHLSRDMEAVCQFAGRSTINNSDLELIMKRQRFVTKERPLHVLIEELCPLEYRRLLIPCAKSVTLAASDDESNPHARPKSRRKESKRRTLFSEDPLSS